MQTSNPNMARAELLIASNRFADAQGHLRQALADDPNDARAHLLLAVCLREDKRYTDATMEARAAVGLAPDDPDSHFILSTVFSERNMPKEAMESLLEAIRLFPSDSRYWGQMASLHHTAKRYKASLEAAEKGLALDPEDTVCINLRALALRGLGRNDDSASAVSAALARNPENAASHANMGWNYLHTSEPKKALEHFREALRLDPEMEWARQGVVEALKARWLPYRLMLRYFLFMARLPGRVQWIILVGGYIGYQVVGSVSKSNPTLAPYLEPLVWAYLAFAVSTWLAVPLFNLLLRTSRFGRLVLSRRETIAANALGISLLLPAIAGICWATTRTDEWEAATWLLLPQVPAVAMAGLASRRRSIIIMCCWAGVVLLYTAALLAFVFLVPTPSKSMMGLYKLAIWPLVIMGFGSVWVFNIANSFPEPRKN